MNRVPKYWGYEDHIVNREYCGKKLTVLPKKSCSIHYHANKVETFYGLSGVTVLRIYQFKDIEAAAYGDDLSIEPEWDVYYLSSGRSITVPAYTPHCFYSANDFILSSFIEFSTHDEPSDSYRIKTSEEMTREIFE